MSLYEELNIIEEKRDVFQAIELIANNDTDDVYVYLRILFLQQDFLLYGKYTNDEYDEIACRTKELYNTAKNRFAQNLLFIFFSALMISIAGNYFENIQIEEVEKLLKTAVESEPDNLLFVWGLNAIPNQLAEDNSRKKYHLSEGVLNDNNIIDGLKELGLLGEYTLGMIKATYQSTKMFNAV